MNPDVIIEARFKTTAEGGRLESVVIAESPYGCPLFVNGEAFDCRLLLTNQTLELGKVYELPVKFMRPDLVLPKLSVGEPVTFWEGKEIALGKVVRLF